MKTTTHGRLRRRWQGITVLALLAGVAAAQDPMTLMLPADSSHMIQVPDGVRKIHVSNPTIVSARPDDDGQAVLVTALKTGKTEVRIFRLNLNDLVYTVEVEPELRELADEVSAMLIDVEGLNVKVVGDKVVLDGELLTQSSARRAKEVADAFGGKVLNLTKLDLTSYTRNVQKALQKEIGIKTVVIKIDGDRLLLMGTVPSVAELERVKEIAKKRADNATILLQVRQ